MRNELFILILLLLVFSCSLSEDEKNYNKLKTFLGNNNFEIENYSSILIVSESGCMNCNKSFANIVKRNLNSKDNLIIISAKGTGVDISPFLESKNTILDFENKFAKLALIKNSASIFLDNNKIDTIINIKAKNIKETLTYINSKL